jgi:hypothetical protein
VSGSPLQGKPNRAHLEALLEGVPLPATRDDLLRHAQREGGRDAVVALAHLPRRRYSTLDEVGEAIAPVQPSRDRPRRVPRVESDLPPGGDRYAERRRDGAR